MDLLKSLKLIRLKENIIRLIPFLIIMVSFFYTATLLQEKNQLEEIYFQESSKVPIEEKTESVDSKEVGYIDTSSLEVLLFIAKDFKYTMMEADKEKAVFEFTEDALFETKSFEEVLGKNDYEYSIQIATGEESWNGIRVEVGL